MTRIRRAFTLIEVLITLTLLSIVLVIAYELIVRMFHSGTVTQWEAVLTNSFSNTDSRLRDYLNASSYPSLITPQGNTVLNVPAFMLGVQGGPTSQTFSNVTAETTLMSWFRCQAGRVGLEGLPDQAPKGSLIEVFVTPTGQTKVNGINICELKMRETPMIFDKGNFQNVTSGTPDTNQKVTTTVMVSDVREVDIAVTGNDPDPTKSRRVQVQVDIKCIEPTQANAQRSRRITAEANVGAKAL